MRKHACGAYAGEYAFQIASANRSDDLLEQHSGRAVNRSREDGREGGMEGEDGGVEREQAGKDFNPATCLSVFGFGKMLQDSQPVLSLCGRHSLWAIHISIMC